MKTRVFITRTIVIATVLVGATLQSFAQPGPGGGRGGLLTQEQRSKLRDAMQPSQTQLTELNQKLATAQREAIKAALAENPDESVVRGKVEAVTKIQTDIAMLRFKGLKEIKSTLTDEQKSR
ncbi:MAG TPA: periplasmic heavy metal sensor, partial [Verrucomicrobiae bacterium]|nr:periplasmic heavy metal sensor [Verrucomicrobiae bacterium]